MNITLETFGRASILVDPMLRVCIGITFRLTYPGLGQSKCPLVHALKGLNWAKKWLAQPKPVHLRRCTNCD